MTLDEYNDLLAKDGGNPAPIDAVALVFHEGRAHVFVRVHNSPAWLDLMSAPGSSDDGIACGVDLRQGVAVASAPFAAARPPEDT